MFTELLKLSLPRTNTLGLGSLDENFVANSLWAVYGIALIFWIVITIILLYHWGRYGYKPVKTTFMGIAYLSGSLFLLLLALSGIVTYTL